MKSAKAIRWTINRAALEFGVGTKTVSMALKAASIAPRKDGKFSTREIAQALFDSEHVQRVRLIKEQANQKKMQNEETEGKLVPVEELASRMRMPLEAMRQRIVDDENLSPANICDLLLDLQALYKCIFIDEKVTRPAALAALKAVEGKQ